MKTLFFLLFLSANVVFAQNKTEYEQILQRGKEALVKEDYKKAILKYRAAEATDPSKKEEVNILIDAVFEAIEKKMQEAENAQKEAVLQTKKAKASKVLAQAEKAKTAQALSQAEKLVNAFYFYEGKFALAHKERKFYFINKNGDKIAKLQEWDKAEQFRWIGFAEVAKEVEGKSLNYLLDTLGNAYQIVVNIEDLSPKIKALDIGGIKLNVFPSKILEHSQLKCLILNETGLKTLPSQIGELSNLTWLDLEGNQFSTLPNEIGELSNLISLDLENNQLSTLPAEIGNLRNLASLDLENNQLNILPKEIGQLTKLTTLWLKHNQLNMLPKEIGQLKNLKKLYLDHNPLSVSELNKALALLPSLEELYLGNLGLSALPSAILGLSKLKKLDLKNYDEDYKNPNTFSEEEQEKIRKLLPNCKVVF